MVPHREGKVNRVGDMNVNGAATRHGPVSVDFVAPTAVTGGRVQASPATALPLAVGSGGGGRRGCWGPVAYGGEQRP
jgi:2-methylaconitate cis-trans-isomerase PrpF